MLSKSAQSIQDALASKGVETRVVELPATTRTAVEAARAIGCEVAQIAKSLVFRTAHTNRPILVLASGPNRVDEQKVSDAVGEEIVKADAAFTRDKTGFAIGGIPPLGHKESIETYIDEDLLQYAELWAAAGTPNAVFRLNSSLLQPLTDGKVIAVK
jgi:prolyl-tRNA editing enzyme YbaK/EbsC (Cys-tRNA(Pro) deacylase)